MPPVSLRLRNVRLLVAASVLATVLASTPLHDQAKGPHMEPPAPRQGCTVIISALTASSALNKDVYAYGHMGMLTASYALVRALSLLDQHGALVPKSCRAGGARFLSIPHGFRIPPPEVRKHWLQEGSLLVQNGEGVMYQYRAQGGKVHGTHTHPAAPTLLAHLRARLSSPDPRTGPTWVVSTSFLPLDGAWAHDVLAVWAHVAHVGVRETVSARHVETYTRRENLTVHFVRSLDVALCAPSRFDAATARLMQLRHPSSADDTLFRVVITSSSRHDGFGELLEGITRMLPRLAAMARPSAKGLLVQVAVPIDDDLERVRRAAEEECLSHQTQEHRLAMRVEPLAGPTPADYLYGLAQAHLVIAGRYHGAVLGAMVERTPVVVLPAKTQRSLAFVRDVSSPCVHFAHLHSNCSFQREPMPQLHTVEQIKCAVKYISQAAEHTMRTCKASTRAELRAVSTSARAKAFLNFPAPARVATAAPFNGTEQLITAEELARQERFVLDARRNRDCMVKLAQRKLKASSQGEKLMALLRWCLYLSPLLPVPAV